MNSLALQPRRAAPDSLLAHGRHLATELLARERRLALYGVLLLVLLVPMALAAGIDERTLRGANVWLKPIKFALAIAVFAFTSAWFIGHLPERQRHGRAVKGIVWLLIGTGSFELGYIVLQAALGQGSHYNVGDTLHEVMYALMGLGALALTATQLLLAWQLHRHGDRTRPPAYRIAVLIGLVLTFVFGAGVGMALGSLQPPDAGSAPTLPLIGWTLAGGDLRPAHFIGLHAQQLLPLAGFWLARRGAAVPAVWVLTALYTLLFAAALAWGLTGRI